jgi:plastocyanin
MRILALIAVLCALPLVGVGCGDDDDNGGGGGKAQTLKLIADPGGALKFDKSSLSANAGKVTIALDNPSSLPHAVEVEGNGVEKSSSTIGMDETTKVTATLKAGEYEFYCPVDGHKAAGMEGTLTVR